MAYVDICNGNMAAASTRVKYTEIVRESGCTGTYSLRALPFHNRFLNTPVEPMHLLKNVAERIVKFISGTTDTVQVRLEEKRLNRFKCAWVQMIKEDGRTLQQIPEALFSLRKSDIAHSQHKVH